MSVQYPGKKKFHSSFDFVLSLIYKNNEKIGNQLNRNYRKKVLAIRKCT